MVHLANLWHAQAWIIRLLQLFRIACLFQRNIALFFSLGLKEKVFVATIRQKKHMPILKNAQAPIFRHLANGHNFWSPKSKHQVPSRCLKE